MTGVLLAAGAGRRAGGPKALRRDGDGVSWLVRSAQVLLEGGCSQVVVVLGCAAAEARTRLRDDDAMADRLAVVEAPDWAEGMSRSLQAGLGVVAGSTDVLVHLVDLPDVTVGVVRRVLALASTGSAVLARAGYSGRPGHPVLIGADHLAPLLAELEREPGDAGARAYLSRREAVLVECGDLASGQDQDGLD